MRLGEDAHGAARTLALATPQLDGPDVQALQLRLQQLGYAVGAADGVFGPGTDAVVRKFQAEHGLTVDGVVGPGTQAALAAAKAVAPAAPAVPATPAAPSTPAAASVPAAGSAAIRAAIVEHARWGIANEAQIHYQQLRPIDGIGQPHKLPLQTDCSGFATLCYRWAGAPDPNGLGFSGQGYTGTILQHCRAIPLSAVRPGDLVAWGAAPGHHVALVLEAGPDPLLCSHGQEKGPAAIRFSLETQYQPAPVTWLSCID